MSVPLAARELAQFAARWSGEFQQVSLVDDTLGKRADAEQWRSVPRIEALFATARTATGALRTSEADSALSEAEALIRSHSELPQAAWLLAEHHALAAELIHDEDGRAAQELLIAAAVLEGERGEAFRDVVRPSADIELPPEHELPLLGIYAQDRVECDGQTVSNPLHVRPGEHHVRVLRGERLLWSGWVSIAEEATSVNLWLPTPAPCSADDVSGTQDSERGPLPRPGTRCADWAVARRHGTKLEVARCHAARCGAWQRIETARAARRERIPESPQGIPRWLTYAAVGAGTALVAGLVLAQSGAFGGSDSSRERWVYTGFK
jgi:hypothetical protein